MQIPDDETFSQKIDDWSRDRISIQVKSVEQLAYEANLNIKKKFEKVSDEISLEKEMSEQLSKAMDQVKKLRAVGADNNTIYKAVSPFVNNTPSPANQNLKETMNDIQSKMDHKLHGFIHNHNNLFKALNPFSK